MNRELRHGWRAWAYRGEHRRSTRRLGHRLAGLALYMSVMR